MAFRDTLRSRFTHVFFAAVLLFVHLDSFLPENGAISPSVNKNDASYSSFKLPASVSLALVHYATSTIVPQQTKEEISVTAKILERRSPCNFLIFGLGFDSLLWSTLNVGGRTVFLEEDAKWIEEVTKAHPQLHAYHVNYTTTLSQAEYLLAYVRNDDENCRPVMELKDSKCRLALMRFPDELYATSWDVIMIDAPRGYFAEAPGRMSAIFSAGLMARGAARKRKTTDILLHDVDRPVEKEYGKAFLCADNLVQEVGRLWHFQIASNDVDEMLNERHSFCLEGF